MKRYLQNKDLRHRIATTIRRQKARLGLTGNKMITSLSRLEEWADTLAKGHKLMPEITRATFTREITLAYLNARVMSAWAFVVGPAVSPGISVLPPNWVSSDNKPNPDIIFQALLTQLANRVIATIRLCECGFSMSARVVLRSILELAWLTIGVISDQKRMRIYFELQDPKAKKTTKKCGQELLRPVAMRKYLIYLEKILGLPNTAANQFELFRERIYKELCGAVHSSYLSTLLNSFTMNEDLKSFEDDLFPMLYGELSLDVEDILSIMNLGLFHFMGLTWVILTHQHKLKIPSSHVFWCDALILMHTATDAFAYSQGVTEEMIKKTGGREFGGRVL
jgi:hypothetical protein